MEAAAARLETVFFGHKALAEPKKCQPREREGEKPKFTTMSNLFCWSLSAVLVFSGLLRVLNGTEKQTKLSERARRRNSSKCNSRGGREKYFLSRKVDRDWANGQCWPELTRCQRFLEENLWLKNVLNDFSTFIAEDNEFYFPQFDLKIGFSPHKSPKLANPVE